MVGSCLFATLGIYERERYVVEAFAALLSKAAGNFEQKFSVFGALPHPGEVCTPLHRRFVFCLWGNRLRISSASALPF